MSATTEQRPESAGWSAANRDGWQRDRPDDQRNAKLTVWYQADTGAFGQLQAGHAHAAVNEPRHDAAAAPLDMLIRAVEAEVLPRLFLARRAALAVPANKPGADLTPSDVNELVDLVLFQEASAAHAYVESLLAHRVTPSAVYLDLLTPAARKLGAMWDEDRCDFTQVTVGLMRLQQVMRAISPTFLEAAPRAPRTASVLLVPAPGEQHTFGLVMVAEFFHRAGWLVAGGPDSGGSRSGGIDPVAMVRATSFAMIGISIGSHTRLDAVARQIRAVRRASRNRAIGVMIGGPLLIDHPEIASVVGADTTAADGAQAVAQAEALLELLR
jgi:methanogenic corrinoid protein MtbC1